MDKSGVKHLSPVWLIVISTLFVAALLGLIVLFDLQPHVIALFRWLDSIGPWAGVTFISLYILLVVLLLPGIFFTLGAGFLFGVMEGGLYVVTAVTAGSTIAFLISRYLFSGKTRNFLRTHQKLKFVNDELVNEGWKIILLTRLVPFFPMKLSNYVFGLTNFSLKHFVFGTLFGIIPNTFLIVYTGSLAADLTMLVSGRMARPPAFWLIYIIGFMFLVTAVFYITSRARRALVRYESGYEPDTSLS